MVIGQKYVLIKHFDGEPKSSDVSIVDIEVPAIQDGEVLVQAEYWTVDPYMRVYSAQLPEGSTMIGSQVAKIIESKHAKWPVGKLVLGNFGWVTHTVFNPDVEPKGDLIKLKPYILPDNDVPASLALGMLGMPGNTAYFGFIEICQPKAGETLVVSGAAGAVGSHVGQIGKILGLKVIGIAGSESKCKWIIDELGFDHAINYKKDDVAAALKIAAPNGVDCYFDNVGGDIASIVINQMNDFGRISVCGSIAAYNSSSYPKATILQPAMVFHQLKMEGFIVTRWLDRWPEAVKQNAAWIKEGKIRYRETVTEGFENMFQAFVGMLKGDNFGKAIIKA